MEHLDRLNKRIEEKVPKENLDRSPYEGEEDKDYYVWVLLNTYPDRDEFMKEVNKYDPPLLPFKTWKEMEDMYGINWYLNPSRIANAVYDVELYRAQEQL
jgi:hypothetical protein